MIKVSHESPACILEGSLVYNDYQYCLVHLMDENELYREWFSEKYRHLRPNGEIMLDNSIFELGKAYDSDKYAEWIEIIKPNYYIIPDSLENYDKTISQFEDFTRNYKSIRGKKVGVVQGKTWNELTDCYHFMAEHADIIAISFDYSYYQIAGNGRNELQKYKNGRIELLGRIFRENKMSHKPHHLLGCSLASEFNSNLYKKYINIMSIDTSNPVVAGILGYRYDGILGLNFKPIIKLAEMINEKIDIEQFQNILYNCTEFKNIIK